MFEVDCCMNIELDFKKIGLKIQKTVCRKENDASQTCRKIDTNQKHLSRIESGYHRCTLNSIVAISKALDVCVDVLIADYDGSSNPSTIKVITDEIKGMSAKQLEMLQENIKTIKKFNQ